MLDLDYNRIRTMIELETVYLSLDEIVRSIQELHLMNIVIWLS